MATITVCIRLPILFDENIKKIAKSLGMNRSSYIRSLVLDNLKKHGVISKKISLCLKEDEDGEDSKDGE